MAADLPQVSLPEGTVTLVLGDLEGSVALWERDKAAMRAATRHLHDLVASAVAAHAGARPLEQGEGDSFVLAFPRASDAVSCALDLQRKIMQEAWPGDLTVRVRMGIHTGDVKLRDGRFYEGATIIRCAHLAQPRWSRRPTWMPLCSTRRSSIA